MERLLRHRRGAAAGLTLVSVLIEKTLWGRSGSASPFGDAVLDRRTRSIIPDLARFALAAPLESQGRPL